MEKNIYFNISEFVRVQLLIVYIYYQFLCKFDRTGLAISCNQEVWTVESNILRAWAFGPTMWRWPLIAIGLEYRQVSVQYIFVPLCIVMCETNKPMDAFESTALYYNTKTLLGVEQAWTSTLFVKNFVMYSVQVGKAGFVKWKLHYFSGSMTKLPG